MRCKRQSALFRLSGLSLRSHPAGQRRQASVAQVQANASASAPSASTNDAAGAKAASAESMASMSTADAWNAQPVSSSTASGEAVSAGAAGAEALELPQAEPGSPSVAKDTKTAMIDMQRPESAASAASGPQAAAASHAPQNAATPAGGAMQGNAVGMHASSHESVPAGNGFFQQCPFKVGEEVLGRVKWASAKGARIVVQGFSEIDAFMPKRYAPFAIRSAVAQNRYVQGQDEEQPCIPKDLVRKFLVLEVPPNMEPGGRGPVVSALDVDLRLLWRRLQQMGEIHKRMRESIRVDVHGAVESGLLVSLSGIRGFLPIAHIPHPPNERPSADALRTAYAGKAVEVSLLEINEAKGTFICSINQALSDKVVRTLTIGSLLWGTVRRLQDYGAFVQIDDSYDSALLHNSNVSWQRVTDISSVLAVGDRVRAVVIGMDEGFTRLSISTRDIEAQEGDMLRDKDSVYANAEETVQRFRNHVREWERNEMQHEEERAQRQRRG